ncbi:MAG: cytochrome c oxidase subunit II transmembrane domain-containing protein [Chitinophagales bacterium]
MATGWLIFIAILLIVVVLFQVTRTLDLVGQLRGGERTTVEMTKFHAILSILFIVLGIFGFFWCFPHFSDRLVNHNSSVHGALIHRMFLITLYVTGIVFVITNILLFFFAYMYRHRPGNKAVHFAHSNKLEFIWTIIPTIVLTGLVVFGLQAWTSIMGKAEDSSLNIEMTGQQFFWTCRYPGPDGHLGPRDNDLICPDNPLGIVTIEWVEHRKVTLAGSSKLNEKGEIEKLKERSEEIQGLLAGYEQFIASSPNKYKVAAVKDTVDMLEDELDRIPEKIKIREKCLTRLEGKYTPDYYKQHSEELTWGYDDPMPTEIHLPVGEEVLVKITALDVLHNFYVPYMDVKMDAVPGMPTSFKFTPTITTEDKRKEISENPAWQVTEEGDDAPRWTKFNYEVACAELCGVGHSAMRYIIVVETRDDYDKWLAEQSSKWSQVYSSLKLENGFTQFAPKIETPATPEVAADSTGAQTALNGN